MSGFTLTLATEADRADLAAFSCGTGEAHRDELNRYVNRQALDELLDGAREDQGFRLVVIREDGELVAVAAHEGNWRLDAGGTSLPGTEMVAFAIAAAQQGRRLADGRSLFGVVLDLVLDDVRACNRGELLTMVVRNTNNKMLGICRNLPDTIERRMLSEDLTFMTRV